MQSTMRVANILIYEILRGSKTYIMITGRIFNFRNPAFVLFIYLPKNQYVPTLWNINDYGVFDAGPGIASALSSPFNELKIMR